MFRHTRPTTVVSQERPAACSGITATYWPTMTGTNSRRAASTAPSVCPRQQPCWQWRPSRPMSPTGTPTRSCGPTAETGITAQLEPATIDGPVYASSMVVLYAARHRVPAPFLARWLLGVGIVATLTVTMTQGWSHGPVGAVVAALARHVRPRHQAHGPRIGAPGSLPSPQAGSVMRRCLRPAPSITQQWLPTG